MLKNRRTGKGYSDRKRESLDRRPTFLIVCEGLQTEPNYFRRFSRPWVNVNVQGLGIDPLRLVQQAAKEIRKAVKEDRPSQVWCVFDRDEVKVDRFNQARDLAGKYGFHVAYSNPAFELWLLLHLQECSSPLDSRRAYVERLSNHLGRPYLKNDNRMFDRLAANQLVAIERAVRLLATYDPPSPFTDDPSTTVHLLVQELLRHEPK